MNISSSNLAFSIIILLFLINCNAQNSNDNDDYENNNYLLSQRLLNINHQGIYINDFENNILGNPQKEKELLSWCTKNKFNQITLYNIKSILSQSIQTKNLNNFMYKAYNNIPRIKVNFIVASSIGVDNIKNYSNLYQYDPYGLVTEYEFWNTGYSFENFKQIIESMNQYKLVNPLIQRKVYLGKIKDSENITEPNEILNQIIKNSEEIYLTNYSFEAYNYSDYIDNKLQSIANEAAKLGKKIKIVIIFNVNQDSSDPNIYDYFDVNNNKFRTAYDQFMIGYNNSLFDNKKWIELIGFQIYNYDYAKQITF